MPCWWKGKHFRNISKSNLSALSEIKCVQVLLGMYIPEKFWFTVMLYGNGWRQGKLQVKHNECGLWNTMLQRESTKYTSLEQRG